MNLFLCGGRSSTLHVAQNDAGQTHQSHHEHSAISWIPSGDRKNTLQVQSMGSPPLLYYHHESEPNCGSSTGSTDTTFDSCVDEADDVSTEAFLQDTKPHVMFSDIQIRMYSMTLGDNPSCSIGPPVQLDWNYEEYLPMDLQAYENARYYHDARYQEQLLLSADRRIKILQRAGFSYQQLRRAERAVLRVRRERMLTHLDLDRPQYGGGVPVVSPESNTEDLTEAVPLVKQDLRNQGETSRACASKIDIDKARSTSLITDTSCATTIESQGDLNCQTGEHGLQQPNILRTRSL